MNPTRSQGVVIRPNKLIYLPLLSVRRYSHNLLQVMLIDRFLNSSWAICLSQSMNAHQLSLGLAAVRQGRKNE